VKARGGTDVVIGTLRGAQADGTVRETDKVARFVPLDKRLPIALVARSRWPREFKMDIAQGNITPLPKKTADKKQTKEAVNKQKRQFRIPKDQTDPLRAEASRRMRLR